MNAVLTCVLFLSQVLGTPDSISLLEILQDLFLMHSTSSDRFAIDRSTFSVEEKTIIYFFTHA